MATKTFYKDSIARAFAHDGFTVIPATKIGRKNKNKKIRKNKKEKKKERVRKKKDG